MIHRARHCVLAGAFLLPGLANAQNAIPIDQPSVKRALDGIKSWNSWVLEQQVSICEIPAPDFKEQVRAAEFKKRLIALGYANTRIDTAGNVIAERPGTGNGPTVMLAGHLDTVFPEGTDVKVKKTGNIYAAPGIGDDCRGLAVVLAVAKALNEGQIKTTGKVILVGDVGEEGSGNLRGMRELFTNGYKGKVDFFISVDGLGIHVTDRAVGSKRYNVHFNGPGGHSYGAFGTMPSAIHAMGRAIALISDVQVPTAPKTTFTVGVVKGGTSVNSIAGDAWMEVDMRSESRENLDRAEADIKKAIDAGLAAENARWPNSKAKITVKYDTIGIRPIPDTPQTEQSPIVRTALEAATALGTHAPTGASSTDANLPMSLGVAAITIGGGGKGEGAHALTETYEETPDAYKGPQMALLLVTALAGMRSSVTP